MYEELLRVGAQINVRVYSPKAKKDLKFVARDSIITKDFVANQEAFVTTLQQVINAGEPAYDLDKAALEATWRHSQRTPLTLTSSSLLD